MQWKYIGIKKKLKSTEEQLSDKDRNINDVQTSGTSDIWPITLTYYVL